MTAHEVLRVSTGCSLTQMIAWQKYSPCRLRPAGSCRIGIAAPDIEPSAWCQTRLMLPNQASSRRVELFVGDEVVGQRPVLGPHLRDALAGGLERGIAGGDGVLAARVRPSRCKGGRY